MTTLHLLNDENGIKKAAEILKNDGTVAIPTETVYGLAASAFSNDAIAKIFKAKGRPQDNPLIVHISNISEIDALVESFPDEAKELAKRFWPGPLTMVLKRSNKVAAAVSAGLDTVAIRMPENEVARQVIEKSGLPLAAPSANLSGSPSPTSADHVIADLDGRIDAIIISENSSVGVESTVVTLAVNPPILLRPGAVTPEQLYEVLPDLVIDKAVLKPLEENEKAASPGMKYKHYAPKTETYLVEAESKAFCEFVNGEENCAAICFSTEEAEITKPSFSYGDQQDSETQARLIFDLLRRCDDLKTEKVYIHAPKAQGVGLAVYNRLIRAAGFKVIKL